MMQCWSDRLDVIAPNAKLSKSRFNQFWLTAMRQILSFRAEAGPSAPLSRRPFSWRGAVEAVDSFPVTPGFNDRQFMLGSLTVDAQLGDHTLTAITGYTGLNFDTATDLEYEARLIRYQTERIRQEEFSQELRLASPGDETITYLAGAYYYQLRAGTLIDDRIAEDAAPIAAALPASLRRQLQGGVVNRIDEETDSFAPFAQIAGHVEPITV